MRAVPLDHFVVESPEAGAVQAYIDIANDVLLDHTLAKAVAKLHIAIDPEYPSSSLSAGSAGSRRWSGSGTSPT